ncbi:MAG: NAD(P)H-hydrate dehydratase [Odoribacteraceae bacterium]|jgi:NAD(P)H-hydrate epimerase|nr:NAD(P)H-hydrate dehydratase [Odoribacteraceae bacterium]
MNCSKLFRTADLPLLDAYTIRHEPVTSLQLMERAATAFVERLTRLYPRAPLFTIVAGTGNNGGDGLAAARLLLERGRAARVYLVHAGDRLSADCAANRERFLATGGTCVEVRRPEEFAPAGGDVRVDALFGAGLNRPARGWVAGIIERLGEGGAPVVALDIPSGLFGEDNRENDGAIARATRTLTFQFPKLAFMLAENYPRVGEFEVLDIGLHPAILRDHPSPFHYLTREAVASALPPRDKFAHKGKLGHALLVAGSGRMAGAALLAARGAARSGAGLLTVHVPRSLKNLVHGMIPEALVSEDASEFHFTGLDAPPARAALGIGPGLGTAPGTAAGLWRLLERWQGPAVLDADALNIVASTPGGMEHLPPGLVLTPHQGEFERLAGKAGNDFDRINKLINFAVHHRQHVVLKGAHAAVATPDGACYFNMTGNPGMAKGGSGDVLTGVITALLANGMPPGDAALAGVFAHGLAGDVAAERHGERGMTSGDVADALGEAWRRCEDFEYQRSIIKL